MADPLDWASITEVAASARPADLLDELAAIVDGLVGGHVWMLDLQRRVVTALDSGEQLPMLEVAARGPAVRMLRHHGVELGLVEFAFDGEPPGELLDALAATVSLSVAAGAGIEDTTEQRRRTAEMSLPAEIQMSLLPPTERRVGPLDLTAAIEPAYDTGGDVFDHVLDGNRLFLGVLDARGHGLRAAALSAVATGAMRRARRHRAGLVDIASEIDTAIRSLDENEFVSGVLVELDLRSWRGRWLTAGHRSPLLVGSTVDELPTAPCLPFGMWIGGDRPEPEVQELVVPADRSLVLYSDGIVENVLENTSDMLGDGVFHDELVAAHDRDGDTHLARGIVERLLGRTGAVLRDDATLMIARRSSRD